MGRALKIIMGIIIVAGLIAVGFIYLFVDFTVDLWWFTSVGYEGYFWQRLLYRYAVFAAVFGIFFLVFFLNFLMASRVLGKALPKSESERRSYRDLLKLVQRGSMWIYTPLSIVLAVLIAFPLFERWESVLLYVFAPNTGIQDITYGKDISYYLFSFHFYSLIQKEFLIAFSILFAALFILYQIESRILTETDRRLTLGSRIHLTILVIFLCLIQAWGYILLRHGLLYEKDHLPLFFGPGFVDMWFFKPLICVTLSFFVLTAFSFIVYVYTHSRRWAKAAVIFVILFIMALGVRHTEFLPGILTKLIVKPNEIGFEKPYIDRCIRSTLAAYGLEKVETRDYPVEDSTEITSNPDLQKSLRNIPVWDRELLDEVYTQLQRIRPYYSCSNVDVGYYTVRGTGEQVYLAARELKPDERNWLNTHLQYTHGHGVVMTPAAQSGEFKEWYIRDIPVRSDYGFTIEKSHIYYGQEKYNFALVPNELGEIDYSKEDNTNVLVNYEGTGGVPLSLFRKLVFAVYFGDYNILWTTKTGKKSRMLFHRNISEAIQLLTPFFQLDPDAYLVVVPQGLFWIQDAFTTSEWYPNAHPGSTGINYIRNSVKIVIDAYNGTVNYYVSDPKDPIISAYKRIYPGLLKDMSQMPDEIKAHLRYPKMLFDIQMEIYARYHQTAPELFYQQEDDWDFSILHDNPMKSHYQTLNLIDPNIHTFLLLCPMSPRNAPNLRALAVAGSDPNHYGRIVVYSFPKGKQIYGPSQVSKVIDQDTVISQEMSLWDQKGSQVKRGRMLILPSGRTILYIQPLYLSSTETQQMPELKRLFVSQGDLVAMDSFVEGAVLKLEEKLKEREKRRHEFHLTPESSAQPSEKPQQPEQPSETPKPEDKTEQPEQPSETPKPEDKTEQPEQPSETPKPADKTEQPEQPSDAPKSED